MVQTEEPRCKLDGAFPIQREEGSLLTEIARKSKQGAQGEELCTKIETEGFHLCACHTTW